jgi:hypothetical protein
LGDFFTLVGEEYDSTMLSSSSSLLSTVLFFYLLLLTLGVECCLSVDFSLNILALSSSEVSRRGDFLGSGSIGGCGAYLSRPLAIRCLDL